MKSWHDLITNPIQPDSVEALLFQCIATICTHPNYNKLMPEEVFDKQVQYARETFSRTPPVEPA